MDSCMSIPVVPSESCLYYWVREWPREVLKHYSRETDWCKDRYHLAVGEHTVEENVKILSRSLQEQLVEIHHARLIHSPIPELDFLDFHDISIQGMEMQRSLPINTSYQIWIKIGYIQYHHCGDILLGRTCDTTMKFAPQRFRSIATGTSPLNDPSWKYRPECSVDGTIRPDWGSFSIKWLKQENQARGGCV